MRRKWKRGGALALSLLLLLTALPSPAQVTVPVGGEEEGFEAMQGRIVAFVNAIVAYTGEERLSAAGLADVLKYQRSLALLLGERGMDGLLERAIVDGRYDFDALALDPDYVAWSGERGLDGGAYFKQLLRLQALRMREESVGSLEQAGAELPEERAALERAREQMGEDAYQESLAALETAAAMVEETRVLMEGLPVATPEEAELLEAHAEEINAILQVDGAVE